MQISAKAAERGSKQKQEHGRSAARSESVLRELLNRDDAKKLAEKVLGYSTYPECSVSITSSEQAFTRFANNGITTAALVNRHSVSIASTREGRSGRTVVS